MILHGVGGKPILAKTKNQKLLVDKLNKKQLVFTIELAGTGKLMELLQLKALNRRD